MWKKPWTSAEGFFIGGGLIVTGLLLELAVGGIDWSAFAWSVNIIVLALFIASVAVMHLFRKRAYVFQFIGTPQAAVPALAYAVILTTVMGLTRQTVNGNWINNMLTFWPFVLIYAYLSVILGTVILKRITHPSHWLRDLSFLLNHMGLFIVLVTATLGSADMQRLKMICATGNPEWRAVDQQDNIVELPLAIELKRFVMEEYDDGSPKRFASDIQILTKTGKNLLATVDVNKPVQVEGWDIYQYGYDTQMGAMSSTSILELVRDPWLPAVYTGICMMLAGALFTFAHGQRRAGRTARRNTHKEEE
ncbi:MAG: cytochrome c biogenesis protein ResB [Prevotella sp.]|nr:cytochrome c biogenesis protein ResB [Prevotella sp.]